LKGPTGRKTLPAQQMAKFERTMMVDLPPSRMDGWRSVSKKVEQAGKLG
jgi:hypothetical protein